MLSSLAGAGQKQILILALDEPRYALYLSAVERVIRAAETTPLPKAPPFVQGVINMQGQVIPGVDIRPCFGLPPREVSPDDCFILARTSRRLLALVALLRLYEDLPHRAEPVAAGVDVFVSRHQIGSELIELLTRLPFMSIKPAPIKAPGTPRVTEEH